ncbi:MAG: ABC transporter permease [Planctomycetota bacterium]
MRLLRFALRNLLRRPGRTALTVFGIGSAILLFVLVESLALGLETALTSGESARTLVVYRKNRFCPQTSILPESYAGRIEDVDGVESVLPVKVYLNNCRASLDLITFQGAPVDTMLEQRGIDLVAGDLGAFRSEADAALVGRAFATRKGLDVGDRFRFGDVDVKVTGIFAADARVDESLILTHLEFLQRAGPVNRLGTVTQLEVRITDGGRAEEVSREIDEIFAHAEEPTDTRLRAAFLQGATRDLKEILRFGRWLGLACVIVVLALVANTVVMSAQDRVREFGVLRAVGFREEHVGAMVLLESIALAGIGALLGLGLAFAWLTLAPVAIGTEGVTITIDAPPALLLRGASVGLVTGLLAGIVPAVTSARRAIVPSLRV